MASGWAALALLSNAFTWGISWWPFRQLQLLGVHPLWATALIYATASAVMLTLRPTAWRALGHHPGLWVLLVAAGLTNVGFNWAVTVGDVVRVVLLFYLMPAWVVLLAWPLLGEKPTTGSVVRLVIALAGVVIVLKSPGSPWPWPHSLADGLALMGGLCFALTNVMLRRLHRAPTSASMLAMFLGGTVMSAATAWAVVQMGLAPALPPVDGRWIAWVAAMSVMFLGGNWGLQYGAARLSASTTSIVMLSEVVFASCSALLLGAGAFTTRTAVGGALIVVAAVLSTVSVRQK